MPIADCQERTTVSKVKVEEKGKKATFLNDRRIVYTLTRVDGCVIKNGIAADWLVSKADKGDIIIELKGKDVGHAVKQIHRTAALLKEKKLLARPVAALIVATQYPKANTAVQRAQSDFAKTYQGPLHVVTKNHEYRFCRVLRFDGPL
jgi:hypothetical protein